MNFTSQYFDFLLPNDQKQDDFSLKKAQTLTVFHLIFLGFSLLYLILSFSVLSNSKVPSFLPLIGVSCLIFIFKKIGNIVISGNLICVLFAILFIPAAFAGGGVYSNAIIWLGLTPVIALMFANRKSGILWFFVFVMSALFYYNLEVNSTVSFAEKIMENSASFYLADRLLFFSYLTAIIFVFSTGESLLVKTLLINEKELTRQRDDMNSHRIRLKQNERELIKLNESLEHYAYAISHDLKEPLRTVKSYTQLLNRSIGKELNEKDKIYMEFVLSGTERMSSLLEDLLNYSRISEVHHEFVPVNLNDVLLLVVNNLSRVIRENNASIEVESNLPLVNGTQSLMVLVIQNLVSNAIKFRHIERAPLIKVYHREEADQFVVCVEDNGIGIANDYKDKVFGLFNRLHTREEYEGSGIGLTTCGKILKSLGGKIWLESILGEGTTFMFSLPKPHVVETESNAERVVLKDV